MQQPVALWLYRAAQTAQAGQQTASPSNSPFPFKYRPQVYCSIGEQPTMCLCVVDGWPGRTAHVKVQMAMPTGSSCYRSMPSPEQPTAVHTQSKL